jgi:integrase
VIRQVFAFGIAEERVAVNPATGFAPLADEKPRVRVLSDSELALWWTTLAAWPGDLRAPSGDRVTVSRSVRIALQLATLLLQRRNEIAGMALSELNLEQGVWLIPGERMKNGLPHLVPLPPRAVELIGEALTLARDGRKDAPPHVFPSTHRAGPIHPDSLTHAMRDITQALGLAGITPHDLRRTGSTALTSERIGVSPFIRSQVLGHRSDAGGGSAVSLAHYDANSYASEKRRALEAWENLLLTIAGEREAPDNLIRLGGAR